MPETHQRGTTNVKKAYSFYYLKCYHLFSCRAADITRNLNLNGVRMSVNMPGTSI